MKIIKEKHIEIWFSSKRRMNRDLKSCFENKHYVIFVSRNDYHRKIGPSIIFEDGEYLFFINGQHHRIDGPNYLDNQKKPLDWYFKGKPASEEAYWNL